jgi:uncharacterized protein (DUF2249 family)
MDAVAEPIDVRRVLPLQRHPVVFASFDALPVGAAVEIVVDRDPLPLHLQFERLRTAQFDWAYLESGPDLWRVRITRLRAGSSDGCGSSCGCSVRG